MTRPKGPVLILDHSAMRRREVAEGLRGCGHRVCECEDMEALLARLGEGDPCLVLVAMESLPDRDVERLGMVRNRLGAGALFVILDEAAGEERIRQCLGMGVDRCFVPPLAVEALCQALRSQGG